MTEDCGRCGAGSVFSLGEEPPDRGVCAEQREKIRRDADRPDALRLAAAGQVFVAADRDRHLFEAPARGLDVDILRRRKPVLGDAEAGRAVPENGEPIGVLIGKRPKDERVRDAEDRGVRADAERDRQHGGGDERAIPREPANASRRSGGIAR